MDQDLIQSVNFGVNMTMKALPGYSWNADPVLTIMRKQGTSGDIARLKLHMLASKGISHSRLMLGYSTKDNKAVALVKSHFRPFFGWRRLPCLLVLDCDTSAIYRLSQTKYSRNSYSLAVVTYGRIILQSSLPL